MKLISLIATLLLIAAPIGADAVFKRGGAAGAGGGSYNPATDTLDAFAATTESQFEGQHFPVITPTEAIQLNVAVDTDGDTNPDYVVVRGDYNGDTFIDSKDLWDSMAALTDTGMKYWKCEGSGTYAYPTGSTPASFYNSGKAGGNPYRSLLDAPSNIAIDMGNCTVLGWPHTVAGDGAILAPLDPVNGNDNIWIRGGTWDGGAPRTATAFSNNPSRWTINFDESDDINLSDMNIEASFHTCLYVSEALRVRGTNLRFKDCGSYWDTSANEGQPAFYVYAHSGGTTSDVSCYNCSSLRSRSAGFNTRKESTTATLQRIEWVGITAIDAGKGSHATSPNGHDCANLRGVNVGRIEGALCVRTGGVHSGTGSSYTHEDVGDKILISNVLMDQYIGIYNVGPYSKGTTHNNIVLRNPSTTTAVMGVNVRFPNRDVTLNNFTIEGGREGIVFGENSSRAPTVGDVRERTRLSNVRVVRTDVENPVDTTYYYAMRVNYNGQTVWGLDFTNVYLTGASSGGFRVDTGTNVTGLRWSGGVIDGTRPQWQGETTIAGLPSSPATNDQWDVTNAASVSNCGATGSARAQCYWTGSAWAAMTGGAAPAAFRPGFFNSGGIASSLVENVHFSNWPDQEPGVYGNDIANSNNNVFRGLTGSHSAPNASASNKMPSVLQVFGTTNLSGWLAMPLPVCPDCVTRPMVVPTAGGPAVFRREQDFVEVTNFTGACTNGQLRRDTDGGASTLYVCESSVWVVK